MKHASDYRIPCHADSTKVFGSYTFWYSSGINNVNIFGCLPEPEDTGYWKEPLSAAKTPEHDGKGYEAYWLYAKMPFEQAFKTNGREAIRNMLKLKPFSQLPLLRGN